MRRLLYIILFIFFLLQQIFSIEAFPSDKVHRIKKEFHQTISIKKPIPLHVTHSLGNIKIIPSSDNELKIDAAIEVASKSKEKAESYIEEIRIDVQEKVTHIKISTDHPRERGIRAISIDFILKVPDMCPLEIDNSFGDIEIGELNGMKGGMRIDNAHGEIIINAGEGEANLINKFGSIKIAKHSGNVDIDASNSKVRSIEIKGNLTIKNSFGKVIAEQIDGDLKISNSNDKVSVKDIKGLVDIKNSFGEINTIDAHKHALIRGSNCSINIDNVKGDTKIFNSFGSIDIAVGGNLIIDTQNSKIGITDVKGEVTIDNSFGLLEVQNVDGKLSIKNPNGNISATAIKNNVFIMSRFSNITLKEVDGEIEVQNTNGNVIANSTKGKVDIETTFGTVRLKQISGDIRVDNSNGSIRLAEIAVSLNSGVKPQNYCKKIDCSTSFGSIQISLPQQASVEINAKTTWGEISTELPLEIEEFGTSDTLTGKLRDGDTIINLTGKNSNIILISE